MASILINLCEFIHHAQKERGNALLFVVCGGNYFADSLRNSCLQLDTVAALLPDLPARPGDHRDVLKRALARLAEKRALVFAKVLQPAQVMSYYSEDIIGPALDIVATEATFDLANHPSRVSAFINFLKWKERIGQERAIGAEIMAGNHAHDKEYRLRLESVISEQRAYERMFHALADAHQGAAVAAATAQNPAFAAIQTLNERLVGGRMAKVLGESEAEAWFELFNSLMDTLHQSSRVLADSLKRPDNSSGAVMPAPAPPPPSREISAHLSVIREIPLFRSIADPILLEVLSHAKIIDVAKGELLFIQGESANRHYSVLEGWVKLFKGNADGEESVLDVTTTGSSLMEAAIFSQSPWPASGQAVERSLLLSIPAAIIRTRISSHSALAINMLASVAERSQQMISQFEQLTLKTAVERIGWFLLKQQMEFGRMSKTFRLPYDKSLIAAYLGMKPETFSRGLQTLKDSGIDIDRATVNLPDTFSLCEYCSSDMFNHCPMSRNPACQQNEPV